MGLFTRKKAQPQLEPTTIYNDETTAVPAIETVLPVPPEPIVQVVPAFVCCKCGLPANPGNQFRNGDCYLGALEHNYLCNNCWQRRKDLVKHRTKAQKPTVIHEAVSLQDRAVNLMEA